MRRHIYRTASRILWHLSDACKERGWKDVGLTLEAKAERITRRAGMRDKHKTGLTKKVI